MRNQSAKGKRKASSNFVDAYSGASELAPPPSSKDVFAVPAKLRRIMELKGKMAEGPPSGWKHSSSSRNENSRKAPKVTKKRSGGFESPAEVTVGDAVIRDDQDAGTIGKAGVKRHRASARWKKGEELQMLVDKMDKREKRGVSAGLSARQKSYLKERKDRKKGKTPADDALPALNQYEKIEFGDVVQAPPKLAFPKKAVQIKAKEKLKGAQDLLLERLRSEAIEAYRKRRVWSSRPGGQQPSLAKVVPLDNE